MCHRVSPYVLLTAHMFLDVTKVTHSTLAALSQSVNLPPADTTNIPKCISKWKCRGMENITLFQDFNRYLSKIFHLVRSDKYHHLHLQKVILHTDIVIYSVLIPGWSVYVWRTVEDINIREWSISAGKHFQTLLFYSNWVCSEQSETISKWVNTKRFMCSTHTTWESGKD